MEENQVLDTTASTETEHNKLAEIREEASNRFQQARAFAAAKVNQIRKTASEQATNLREFASEKSGLVCDKAKKFHEAGEDYIKEKPTQSVLIALGIGVLIGFLIRRR